MPWEPMLTFNYERDTFQGAGGYLITGLPENNNPETQRQFEEALEDLATKGTWDGAKFNITLPGVDMQKARIGDLRTAYLVAFAALGYRFAFNKALNPVREQLLNVEEKLLENYHWILHDRTAEGRHLVLMQEPITAVCVQLERTVICLPDPTREEEFYGQLPDKLKSGGDLRRKEIRWPMDMKLAFDWR